MRCVIIGLGIQGKKRLAIAGNEAVATVDPVAKDADQHRIEDVPLDSYDSAFVCTPDAAKFSLLEYLLTRGKKPATVNRRLVALQRFYKWAQKQGHIASRRIAARIC